MTVVLDAGDYPLTQYGISGIGLRVAELAAALAHHLPVVVYSPATGNREPVDTGDAVLITEARDWPQLLATAAAVMFFDMPDLPRMQHAVAAGTVILSENTAPVEQLEYPRLRPGGIFDTGAYQRLVDAYRYQLTHSQLLVARSAIERLTAVANLAAYGLLDARDIATSRLLAHRILTIPLGFSHTTAAGLLPVSTARRRTEVLWTGGLWAFTDPVAAVRAVAAARARGTEVTLRFLHAAPHPDTAATTAAVTTAAADLGVAEHVLLHTDPIAHRDRDRSFTHAAALICLARPGIENQTCVRLRARDSRLYGLPLIVDPHGATAVELAADELAIPIDPDDTTGLADLLTRLVTPDASPPRHDAGTWAYEHTIAPLVAWLHDHLPPR
ncbi:hypothetical protein [Nocardia sp. alder85J]|uniref:hypothetical protein n=1 Tax=Nocardia sp. alder85J TaxID=2862949 RepID=UPI001CD6804F|nr:hypothetical protein [Nocardia sp. alder85J]MCX4097763.1 hypothetical protein [Nocardia sp. alder85J]